MSRQRNSATANSCPRKYYTSTQFYPVRSSIYGTAEPRHVLLLPGTVNSDSFHGVHELLAAVRTLRYTRRFAPRAASPANYARSQGRIEHNATEQGKGGDDSR